MPKIVARIKPGQGTGQMFCLTRFLDQQGGRLVVLNQNGTGKKATFTSKSGLIVPRSAFRIVSPAKVLDEVFIDIREEMQKAIAKYPSADRMVPALSCEAGEAVQAIIKHHVGADSPEHIYQELIQTCAVAVRLMFIGDTAFRYRGYFPDVQPIPIQP